MTKVEAETCVESIIQSISEKAFKLSDEDYRQVFAELSRSAASEAQHGRRECKEKP